MNENTGKWTVKDIFRGQLSKVIFWTIILSYLLSIIISLIYRSVISALRNTDLIYMLYKLDDILELLATVLAFILSIVLVKFIMEKHFEKRRKNALDPASHQIVEIEEKQAKSFKWTVGKTAFVSMLLLMIFTGIAIALMMLANMPQALALIAVPFALIFFGSKKFNQKMMEKTKTNTEIIEALQNGLYDNTLPQKVKKETLLTILSNGLANSVDEAISLIKLLKISLIGVVAMFFISIFVGPKIQREIDTALNLNSKVTHIFIKK